MNGIKTVRLTFLGTPVISISRDWLRIDCPSEHLDWPTLSCQAAETNQFVYLVFYRCFKCAAMRENYVIGEICQQFTQRVWKLCLHNPWCPLGACTCRRKDICGLLKVTARRAVFSAAGGKVKCGDLAVWDMDPVTSEALYLNCRPGQSKLSTVSSIDIGKFWLLAITDIYGWRH